MDQLSGNPVETGTGAYLNDAVSFTLCIHIFPKKRRQFPHTLRPLRIRSLTSACGRKRLDKIFEIYRIHEANFSKKLFFFRNVRCYISFNKASCADFKYVTVVE
jgi:hypothetical protein